MKTNIIIFCFIFSLSASAEFNNYYQSLWAKNNGLSFTMTYGDQSDLRSKKKVKRGHKAKVNINYKDNTVDVELIGSHPSKEKIEQIITKRVKWYFLSNFGMLSEYNKGKSGSYIEYTDKTGIKDEFEILAKKKRGHWFKSIVKRPSGTEYTYFTFKKHSWARLKAVLKKVRSKKIDGPQTTTTISQYYYKKYGKNYFPSRIRMTTKQILRANNMKDRYGNEKRFVSTIDFADYRLF